MHVTARLLNGRASPSKRARIEAFFDEGDVLYCLRWSKDHHWIEAEAGEGGTVWVWWEYLNEQEEEYSVWWNDSGTRIKIRKEPFGRVVGYLKRDGEVVVDRIVFGWGKCERGWIDLQFLTEED